MFFEYFATLLKSAGALFELANLVIQMTKIELNIRREKGTFEIGPLLTTRETAQQHRLRLPVVRLPAMQHGQVHDGHEGFMRLMAEAFLQNRNRSFQQALGFFPVSAPSVQKAQGVENGGDILWTGAGSLLRQLQALLQMIFRLVPLIKLQID